MLPFKKPVHRQQTLFFRRPSLGIQLIYFSPTACQLPITDTDWDARSRIWECVVSNFKSEIDRADRVSAIGHKSYYLSLLPHCTLLNCISHYAPAANLQPESNWIFPWGSTLIENLVLACGFCQQFLKFGRSGTKDLLAQRLLYLLCSFYLVQNKLSLINWENWQFIYKFKLYVIKMQFLFQIWNRNTHLLWRGVKLKALNFYLSNSITILFGTCSLYFFLNQGWF